MTAAPLFVVASGHIVTGMTYNAPHDAGKTAKAMSEDGNKPGDSPETGVVVRTKPATKKPSMYKVLMLNDDYTPMEFVVHVLQQFFGRSVDEANQIMLNVHQRGVGICGIYSFEIAETKASKTMEYARQKEHPLQLQLEKE